MFIKFLSEDNMSFGPIFSREYLKEFFEGSIERLWTEGFE